MPPVSILIKPASSSCNLRCKYCFYHSLAEKRQIDSYGVMNEDTLEALVEKALGYADYSCTFAFQGGEPTLAGLGFYKKLIEFEKKHNIKKIQINNAIQTNGTTIDDEWAGFLARNKFLVGLSLDGPKDIHDFYRMGPGGKGSFMRVMETVNYFNKHRVEYNILSVVTANVARHVGKIYSFYKKCGFHYLQFIPCIDPLGEEPGGYEHSLAPGRYAYFLKNLFDQWYSDVVRGNMISIRYFDNIVGLAMGRLPEECGMLGICPHNFVVEADGSVYPCDFYVTDRWRLGSLKSASFEDITASEVAVKFVEDSKHVHPGCGECKWYGLCRGGCRRNREPFFEDRPVLNYYCEAYREFFEYAGDRIYKLARMFSGG